MVTSALPVCEPARNGSFENNLVRTILSGRQRVWTIAAALLSVLFVVFASNAGRWLVVDAAQRSDVIYVLAGETEHRPVRALELLAMGYGRKVVIGVPATAKTYDFTQMQLAEEYVQRLPQSASTRICPIEGLSTRDEAHDAGKCLAREKGSRILLVTSEFHTRRALSIFRHELPERTFSVAATYDDTQFGTRWWTRRQWAKTCLDEWLRLSWWTVIDRWR